MFEISNQWLLFVLDLSAKSLVLALVAGIAMKLFRLRDSNLRHRIWSGVLIGMLALPLLSLSLPAIPVSVSQEWNAADASALPEAEPLALAKQPTFADEFAIKTNVISDNRNPLNPNRSILHLLPPRRRNLNFRLQ